MFWNEARVKRLKELWEAGLSASLIGDELGVTRNSVIGKAWRLGLKEKVTLKRVNSR